MNSERFLKLHHLPKTTANRKKRVGRGYGSGKGGHTSGRGQKGQRSRRTIPWWFEGGQLPLVRRVPFWRGKGRLNPLKQKPVIVKTGRFNILKSGDKVTIDTLIHERMVNEAEARSRGVKILADGKLTKKITVEGIPMSAGAKKEIDKAGVILSGAKDPDGILRPKGLRMTSTAKTAPRKKLMRRVRASKPIKLRKTK